MTDSTSRGPARPVRSTYSAYSIYAAFDDVALAALPSVQHLTSRCIGIFHEAEGCSWQKISNHFCCS